MDEILAAVAASDVATALRMSRWGYAAVNTAHVLGIALLVGGIVPLDLRLLGLWPGVARDGLVRTLVPVAATGLGLAVTTGAFLFSVRAPEYAALTVLQIKLALVVLGGGSAIALHLVHGFMLETASSARLARAGALSMTCWLGALIAGRMIAFAGD
ncbi:MAG: DUF2214 domain-containing protein [Methyloligellaceae bacterium]